MEKLLKAHIRYIEQQLTALEPTPAAAPLIPPSTGDAATRIEHLRALFAYHLAQTQAFQHERFIHLLVTLFFALLLLAAIVGTLLLPVWQLLAVTILLTIIEMFYLRHYYALENNTQKLYPLTRRLHEKLNAPTSAKV